MCFFCFLLPMCHFARLAALTHWVSIRFMAGRWVENGLDVAGGLTEGSSSALLWNGELPLAEQVIPLQARDNTITNTR